MYEQDNSNLSPGLVAKFGKALQMKLPDRSGMEDELWLVLGYFDTLRLYPLPREPEDNQIGAMWKENIVISKKLDGDFYFHPLHMISQEKTAQQKMPGTESPYLLLSLVQGTGQENLQKLEKELADCQARCYHTLELSDLIVLWESDCLVDLLRNLRRLHEDPKVSDTDTFVAIRYTFLRDRGWVEKMPEADRYGSIYAAARYVVRNTEKKQAFLRDPAVSGFLRDSAFFTTGIEDLHIVRSCVGVTEFLEFLYATLFAKPLAETFQEAFSSAITQIGLRECAVDSPPAKDPPDLQRKLTNCCDALLKKFKSVRDFQKRSGEQPEQEDRRSTSWSKPAGNLYNGLLDMSRSSILDGFCYLILDAAAVFCGELDRWNKQNEDDLLTSRQLELVQRFVRGWGALLEHSTRMDGRFIQMPGFTPSLCEIPARLLEFYLAFAHLCVEKMQLGAEPGESVAFLLVPKICRRMKVEPIFLNEEAEGKHLLYMDVPLDMLYDPNAVMCVICHEAAHFVGGKWRHREARQRHLLLSVANELAYQLDLESGTAVAELYNILSALCGATYRFLRPLKARLHGVILSFLEDTGAPYQDYLRDILNTQKAQQKSEEELYWLQMNTLFRRNELLSDRESFLAVVDNLAYLFQECYADASMILLFGLDRSRYLALARQELDELAADKESRAQMGDQNSASTDSQEDQEDSRYYIIAERWSALLRLESIWENPDLPVETFSAWLDKTKDSQAGVMRAFLETIDTVCNPETWGVKNGKAGLIFNNSASFQQLMEYLDDCCEDIRKSCREAPSSSCELKDVFERMAVRPQLDYDSLANLVDRYRRSLLNELCEDSLEA